MVGKVVVTALKILAVCLVFAVCFVAGGALSGLSKISQQATPSTPALQPPSGQQVSEPPVNQAPAQKPENLLYPFLIFSVCAGVVLAYLILHSSWHGWPLVGAIFVGMYGISTVATQVETLYFLSHKLPNGMIRAIFLQGAISAALFAPLAVLLLGKWRTASPALTTSSPGRLHAPSIAARLAVIVVAFVFLYMFFGYYVAWQNPALRQYYGGREHSSFYAAMKANWVNNPWIYALQVFRALLYATCISANSHASGRSMGSGPRHGAFPLCLDHHTAPPQPADASHRGLLTFPGNLGLQHRLWWHRRLVLEQTAKPCWERYCVLTGL